jgi:hypothetical protein
VSFNLPIKILHRSTEVGECGLSAFRTDLNGVGQSLPHPKVGLVEGFLEIVSDLRSDLRPGVLTSRSEASLPLLSGPLSSCAVASLSSG